MKKVFMLLVVVVAYQVNSSWAINSYTDFTNFSTVSGPLIITNFDNITSGSTFTQQAVLDDVSYNFISMYGLFPTNFKVFNYPLRAISAPNIFAAAKVDGTFETGTTTLNFPYGTKAAGLYLIMPTGLNSSIFATSNVIAKDFDGNVLTTAVIFQGQVGKKRFIGFDAPSGISSIIFPSATQINGFSALSMDNVCYSLISDLYIDDDHDGFTENAGDCDDDDGTIYPGASEVKHDGIDQDCNGYDLTIDILEAKYTSKKDSLKVEATSDLGQEAMLKLEGYSSMQWKREKETWKISILNVGGNPGFVTVCGVEGCVSIIFTLRNLSDH